MAKITCKIPGAKHPVINGIKFEQIEDHIISEEISDEQAAYFIEIPGYALADAPDMAMVELTAQAIELGIKVDTRWKSMRLTAEIAKARTLQMSLVKAESFDDGATVESKTE